MYPTQLHSYLLWRASVKPDAQTLASRRYTATVSLLPAVMVGIFVFGWWAGTVLLLALATAFLTDLLCSRWFFRETPVLGVWTGFGDALRALLGALFRAPGGTVAARDGTWLLTGLLLGLLLPPNVPWQVPVLGAGAGILIGKHYLSVDNMPLLQPAAVGLLLLHLAGLVWPGGNPMWPEHGGQPRWPVLARGIEPTSGAKLPAAVRKLLRDFFGGDVRMSVTRAQYRDAVFAGQTPMYEQLPAEARHGPRPLDLVKANPGVDISSGAKLAPALGNPNKTEEGSDWVALVLGGVPATIGGSSALALGFGILLLIFTGAASPVVPAFALATMFTALHFLAWLSAAYVVPGNIPIHLLTGSTILGLFYLAADPTTAPRSFVGRIYGGVALGLLETVLRIFTPLAEGIFISVIVLQLLSFALDQWLAPPGEDYRPGAVGISSSSVGRL
ncbi:MAG: RnfABCDGE type electron transport complex subunit D [Planctomycetota bacterium]